MPKKEIKPKKQPKAVAKKRSKVEAKPEQAAPLREEQQGGEFYTVGIGASAGGLEAFEQFFSHMPEATGMAFVLVSHLDPSHVSMLPELLQKYTRMGVRHAEDGMKVEPNSVYVIPPNRDIAILQGVLQLIEQPGAGTLKLPIDYFFRSLAQDQGKNAIGIILSGGGMDGTLGLKAIQGEGGIAMVQDPKTAKYDGMPRNAINAGVADYILPPEEMPNQLIKYARHVTIKEGPRVTPLVKEAPNALQKIFILVREKTGHDFSLYKRSTIWRRIERRMGIHQLDRVTNYVSLLQRNPQEIEILYREFLIGVTSFFRDAEAFEVLKTKIIPQMLKDKPRNYTARVWVPGCSSGEEAYSLAILFRECMDDLEVNLSVQIFATDIDPDAIEAARRGVYPDSISADVSPTRLKRFFTKEDNTCKIRKDIREMVIFAAQNLIKDPPFTKLDLISCRNLLIYLDSTLQKRLIPIFHYSLKPGGTLFLGTSETIGEFTDLFAVVDKKWKIYRCSETTSSAHVPTEFPAASPYEAANGGMMREIKKAREVKISQSVENILLESYAPPCAIINEKGDIVYIHGRTGKYLEPAAGEASLNILEMAREGLRAELTAAVHKAISQKQKVIYEGLRVKNNGGFYFINLSVRPISEPENLRGLVMVVFEDVGISEPAKPDKTKRHPAKNPEHMAQLEQELKYTKEHLQAAIEELETSNEELKSANEELQSTNEELQSANEELETSKEEQQSLNEELATLNSELQGRIEDLTKFNDDMRNLLDSTEIAVIFLDNSLQIRRFTPKATNMISLIPSDAGRPIADIASKLRDENLVEDAREVIQKLAFKEREVQTRDGHWYMMRILPYRTIANVIDGAVVVFEDIAKRKQVEEKLQGLQEKEIKN